MKDRLIKYTAMIAALIIGGEGYLALEELRQLRSTADSAIETTQKAVAIVAKLDETAKTARSKCIEARGKAVEITTELKEIRKQLKELKRKLRLKTKVFP